MRRLVQGINERIAGFVDQRDDLALVPVCDDAACPFLLKIVEEVDQGGSPHMFWMFAEAFEDEAAYVDAVAASFEGRHALVCDAFQKTGAPPWPPVPDAVRDATLPPVARLRELITFARTLRADPEEQLLVWAMVPTAIEDSETWGRMVADLLAHDFPSPWCHHVRFVVREDAESPALGEALAGRERIEFTEVDFGMDKVEEALLADAADEEMPLALRMQSVLVAAGIDYAEQRYDQALMKYVTLLPYYAGTENHALWALVLNGMGEVHEKLDDPETARLNYEAAVTPAADGKAYPVLQNVTLNLANLEMAQERWAEAADYYNSAALMATAFVDPGTKLRCMENGGVCRYALGERDAAVALWEEGVTLSKGVDAHEERGRLLARLEEHYARVGDRENLKRVRAERAELPDDDDEGNGHHAG
jgi:hypothetical protein